MKAVAGQLGIGAALIVVLAFCWRLQDASAISLPSGTHLMGAGGLTVAWLGFAVWMTRRGTRHDAHDAGGILVVHASQTGFATELAAKTADELRAGGLTVDVRSIDSLTPAILAQAKRALFIASTTGEGDAPDAATGFRGETMRSAPSLAGLSYGVLALGDRDYDDFCAFGRELDGWLRANGATPLFDRVEVDNGDEGSLRHWQHHVAHMAGTTGLADWTRPAYQRWRLGERMLLNPGSEGAPCYHIALEPLDATHLKWQAGDIAEIGPRRQRGDDTTLPHREYSIASLPADGALHLVVRQMRGTDGVLGVGSGWLTEHAAAGDTIDLRVRTNVGFHPPVDDRPVVLIGNGTGIAGLRALLKARLASAHHRNWLVFGERHSAADRLHVDELERWREQGRIERLDLVWSREGGSERYVQDRLRASADALRRFIEEGASIYVCGSLDGMAPGVDAALRGILGDDSINALAASGRYRRDVY